ncbi:MAG: class II aldolase/adducin family protein [Myxococcota bacterium]
MALARRQLEEQVIELSHRLGRERWVANHDGNITARLANGCFLATPTALAKLAVDRASLIVVDDQAKLVSGSRPPFSELALHLAVYRHRPDVQAVIHAHPPSATGLSVAGIPVRTTMLAEPVVSLGAEIPLVPYAAPKTPEWTGNMIPLLDDADALLLEQHGVLTYGPDLETAFLRMELVEHLAKIQIAAHQAGLVRDIPDADVGKLLGARTKTGLGKAARQASAEAPPARATAATGGASAPGERVESIIVEEIGRALRE